RSSRTAGMRRVARRWDSRGQAGSTHGMTPSSREERTPWRARDDAKVFVALERARRLCARLRELPDGPPPGPDAFAAAEARLGLAGFVACEHLVAAQREALRREAGAVDATQSPDRLAGRLAVLATTAGR